MSFKQIKELIKDPKNWTTNVYARDALGAEVSPKSPFATCWCLQGAIYKLSKNGIDSFFAVNCLHDALKGKFPQYISIVDLNDNLGHKAVMELLEEVIIND